MARNTVGARELKTRLAELRPLQDDVERKLAKLRTAGLIGGGDGRLQPLEPLRIPGVSLSDAILEDRDDRF